MKFKPSWAKHEEKMRSDNVEESIKATDAFVGEREHETKVSTTARKWEEDRKKEWAKNKPEFAKKVRSWEGEQIAMANKKLREFGSHKPFKPARGYLIINVTPITEEKSGIYVGETEVPHDGTVLDIGEDVLSADGIKYTQPCKRGDHIVFKKGAGMDIEVDGVTCRFIQFSDVLGVYYA